MAKRSLTILLVLCLLVGLTACGNEKMAEQKPAGPKTTLELLKSAGEKLRNADTFQLDIWSWSLNMAIAEPELFSVDSKPTVKLYEMQYVSDLNGAPASYLKEWKSQKEPQVDTWHYLGDSTGYGGEGDPGQHSNNYKHFSEKSFTAKQRFWVLNSMMDIGKDTLFAEFCALEPTVTTAENGTTTVEARMNYEQLRKLLNVEVPMHTGHAIEIGSRDSAIVFAYPNVELSLEFVIDAQGYLQHIAVKSWNRQNDSTEYDIVRTVRIISFSRINEELKLDATAVSKGFMKDPEQNHYFVHYYQDEYQAVYCYDPERNVFDFWRILKNWRTHTYVYDEEYMPQIRVDLDYIVLPPYRLLTEVENCKVQTVWSFNESYFLEQLIIPKGVTFNYGYTNGWEGAYRQLDKVFFEDSEASARITVKRIYGISGDDNYRETEITLAEAQEQLGGIPYYNDQLLEKFYFAGQWEYVNGVPTPIQ